VHIVDSTIELCQESKSGRPLRSLVSHSPICPGCTKKTYSSQSVCCYSAAGAWNWPLPSPSAWRYTTNAPRVYDFMARCVTKKIVPFHKTQGYSRRNILHLCLYVFFVPCIVIHLRNVNQKNAIFKFNSSCLLHVSNILCSSFLPQVKTYHFYAFIDNLKT